MSWFKRLHLRKNEASEIPTSTPVDRIAALADSLFAAGRIQALEAELLAWKDKELSRGELISWHVLWTASAFRRDDRRTAFDRAEEAIRSFHAEPEIIFAMGQEHEYRGNIEEMVRHFRRAEFPRVSSAHTLAGARYCYLRGRFDAGLELLRPMLDAHFALGIADDTFLYIRGMPFATTTFAAAACLHLLNGGPAEAHSLLERAQERISDCYVGSLKPFIDAHQNSSADIAIASLEANRAPHLSTGPLGGYAGIELASWRSRRCGSLEDATKLLSRIAVRETDPPWHNDVLTLAQAEACERFGAYDREIELIRTFVKRQPLLLEPDWTLRLGFIRYQERVRTEHWATLTGRNCP